MIETRCITLFRFVTVFCGIDNILRIILHIQIEYGEYIGIFYGILSVLQNIVMDLNNVMCRACKLCPMDKSMSQMYVCFALD